MGHTFVGGRTKPFQLTAPKPKIYERKSSLIKTKRSKLYRQKKIYLMGHKNSSDNGFISSRTTHIFVSSAHSAKEAFARIWDTG
jgi:hypothetical protein